MESIGQDHHVAFVKKTKDPEDVASLLNPDLIQPVRIRQVLQLFFRHMRQVFNEPDRPNDLIPHFQSLPGKEVTEVRLVQEDRPYFKLVHWRKDTGSCRIMQPGVFGRQTKSRLPALPTPLVVRKASISIKGQRPERSIANNVHHCTSRSRQAESANEWLAHTRG